VRVHVLHIVGVADDVIYIEVGQSRLESVKIAKASQARQILKGRDFTLAKVGGSVFLAGNRAEVFPKGDLIVYKLSALGEWDSTASICTSLAAGPNAIWMGEVNLGSLVVGAFTESATDRVILCGTVNKDSPISFSAGGAIADVARHNIVGALSQGDKWGFVMNVRSPAGGPLSEWIVIRQPK